MQKENQRIDYVHTIDDDKLKGIQAIHNGHISNIHALSIATKYVIFVFGIKNEINTWCTYTL